MGISLIHRLFGGKHPKRFSPPQLIRWSENGTLSLEDAACKGLETLLGLMLDEDPFWLPGYPSLNFDLGASFYYSPGSEQGDFIGVYVYMYLTLVNDDGGNIINANIRSNEEFIHPRWGTPLMKLVMQPISDGTVNVIGNYIDTNRASESMHGIGMMLQDDNIKEWRVLPVEVGTIPQGFGDEQLPHFLVTYDAVDEHGNIMLHPRTLLGQYGTIRPYPIGWLEGWSAFRYFKTEKEADCIKETYTHFWPKPLPDRSLHYLTENGKLHWMVGNHKDWTSYLSQVNLPGN